MNLIFVFCWHPTKHPRKLHVLYRRAICNLGHSRCDTPVKPLDTAFDRDWKLRHSAVHNAGLMRWVVELTNGRRDSQDICVARLSGIPAGEIGDALESVPHRVWMNEQLA